MTKKPPYKRVMAMSHRQYIGAIIFTVLVQTMMHICTKYLRTVQVTVGQKLAKNNFRLNLCSNFAITYNVYHFQLKAEYLGEADQKIHSR